MQMRSKGRPGMDTSAEKTTVGTMAVGQVAYIHASGVLFEAETANWWLDRQEAVYNASSLGAQITRTEDGYSVQVLYGSYPSVRRELSSPEKTEFVAVNEYSRALRH